MARQLGQIVKRRIRNVTKGRQARKHVNAHQAKIDCQCHHKAVSRKTAIAPAIKDESRDQPDSDLYAEERPVANIEKAGIAIKDSTWQDDR